MLYDSRGKNENEAWCQSVNYELSGDDELLFM